MQERENNEAILRELTRRNKQLTEEQAATSETLTVRNSFLLHTAACYEAWRHSQAAENIAQLLCRRDVSDALQLLLVGP